MSHPWEPSQAYKDYCAATKKERPMEVIPSFGKSLAGRDHTASDDALWATQTTAEGMALPFCSRYQPIPAECATCVHSLGYVPCPDSVKEVFLSIDDQGGIPSALVSESDTEVTDVQV